MKMTNADWMFAEFRATGYYESEDFRNEDPPDEEEIAGAEEAEFWEATTPPEAVDDYEEGETE